MKIRMFLLISTVVLLSTALPINAQSDCGTFTQSFKIICTTAICSSSVTISQPAGPAYIQYVSGPVYCCGSIYTSWAPEGTFCIWQALRDPETQENLRRALFIQDLLIASCDGTYHRFDRLNDRNLPLDPKSLKPRLPLS